MTRIVCISDTHDWQPNLPDGDILLVAGDMTMGGDMDSIRQFNSWMKRLPHEYKVCCAGNHDFLFERSPAAARLLMQDCIYLEDSFVEVKGFKIYGSPHSPRFFDWAFNVDRGESLKQIWKEIPDDTDILITHTPPMNILDYTKWDRKNVGCEELAERVRQLPNLKLHVFGHIHHSYGHEIIDDVNFVNGSVCNERYHPVNTPIVVDL